MAHKRSNKKTSFGKKSGPEKAFIRRGRKPKSEEKEERPTRSFGALKFSRSKTDKTGSSRFSKKDSDENQSELPAKSFRRSRSFEKPNRFDGDKSKKDGFRKREGADKKFKRSSPQSNSTSFEKPNRFEGNKFKKDSFRKREGAEKKFERSSSQSSTSKRKFSKRDEDVKSGQSIQALGFTKKSRTAPKHQPEYPNAENKVVGLTRLNKHIANSGMGSRREADEMIKKGLISVNGVTITEMGFKVKPGDVVRYEDQVLKAEKLVYVLLNKPKGFITTTADPQERKTVMNLVASACKERLYPVGRLDRNTTGLLLLTNDGELAEKLTHPSYNTKKIYKVELDKPLTKVDFQKIQDGIRLEEGKAIVDDLAYVSDNKKEVGIELHIGWNRIVRRIFESLDYQVVKLDRVIFAGLDKKDLPRGEWRFLKPEEVVRLKHFK